MGSKSTFRLLNRGSAKALDKVAELYGIGTIPLVVGFDLYYNHVKNLKFYRQRKGGADSQNNYT